MNYSDTARLDVSQVVDLRARSGGLVGAVHSFAYTPAVFYPVWGVVGLMLLAAMGRDWQLARRRARLLEAQDEDADVAYLAALRGGKVKR